MTTKPKCTKYHSGAYLVPGMMMYGSRRQVSGVRLEVTRHPLLVALVVMDTAVGPDPFGRHSD